MLMTLNNCIWKKVLNDIFVYMKTLHMGVASAVIHYNDGGCVKGD